MQVANPTHGELVEAEEEAEEHPGDEIMQETLDEMIEEINSEIIPEGEELLRKTETQVETAEEVHCGRSGGETDWTSP